MPDASAAPPSYGKSSWSVDDCPSSFGRQSADLISLFSWNRRFLSNTLLELEFLKPWALLFPVALQNLLFTNLQVNRPKPLHLPEICLILPILIMIF